jgi:hypothetical protein
VCGVEVSTFNLLKDSGSNPDIKKCHELFKNEKHKTKHSKKVKQMKINWLDESPLTYEEAMELLSHSHEKRLEMEDKNKWDAYVNDFTFWTFLHDTYNYMRNEIKKEIDIDLYYFYPKIKDFIDLETILLDSEKFRLTKEVLQLEKKENVWEIVEDWWELTFKILLK